MDVNQKFSEDVDQQHIDMTPLSLAAALNKVEAVKVGPIDCEYFCDESN